ncbi:SidA/IucD/PvdA family monooxygenase [Sphaerisporangium flaviroseum]|uniref:L-lysine N6-monooxygenase MbtG n=1 Tax=Sphaerisporangium flaviroseum TaxID=509199 RepID=A0ABP7I6K4_9ACTN
MERFDVVGAGLGPFNLSLAALLEPLPDIRMRFFEAQPSFRWHGGIMVPGAQLQVSFLKDLVTLVDPSNVLSFLNYLASEGRLYRFLIAHADRCSRQEFERYYQWAADQLKSVRWDHPVERVDLKGDAFEVGGAGESVTTRNVVLGSGRKPFMPAPAVALHGPTVLHSSELRLVEPELAGRDVLVVGAGQSGAEVVNHLLSGAMGLPGSLTWVSSRLGFLPLDDSPFTNEWFHPAYVDHFYGLSAERRRTLLDGQRMASDGISDPLLREVYRRLYELDVLEPGRLRHRLLVCRRLVELTRDHGRLVAGLHDQDTGEVETCTADVVICCTGYRSQFPEYLEPLRGRLLDADGRMSVRRDYSLEWDGPADLGIYVQNAAESTHGIADPNLSLAAWRSARIINSICGRTVYRTEDAQATVAWKGTDRYPLVTPVGEVNA